MATKVHVGTAHHSSLLGSHTARHLGINRRYIGVLVGLPLAIWLVVVLQVSYGDYPMSIADAWRGVLRLSGDDPVQQTVIWTSRMPRIIVALLVGSGLSVAGALMQGLTRNSLASPDILGISAGAAAAVIGWLILAPQSSFVYRPVAAFAGGMGSALLIYLLAWRAGASPLRLILVGIGLGALTSTMASVVLLMGNYNFQQNALVWLSGRVSVANWGDIRLLAGWTLGLIAVAVVLARHLNTLTLGHELATGLGAPLQRLWAGLAAVSVALTAGGIAIAGIIGFVGLMGPHIARRLVGGRNERVMPVAALTGALLVLTADFLGRLIGGVSDVPAGLITSIIGAPIFFVLLARGGRL